MIFCQVLLYNRNSLLAFQVGTGWLTILKLMIRVVAKLSVP